MLTKTTGSGGATAEPKVRAAPSEDASLLAQIVEWDVGNWGRAVRLWDRDFPESWAGRKSLDLGAGGGGLTLYLRLRGCHVTYCDIDVPREQAYDLFRRHGLDTGIDYCRADVTCLPFPDEHFDVVTFKSLLGAVGRCGGRESQARVLTEAHRVLRPNGVLLFAENARGSSLHAFCRDRFVAWGRTWRYPSHAEMYELLTPFRSVRIKTFGTLATLGRREWQRRALSRVDHVINPLIPEKSRYLVYGFAIK